MLPDYPDVKRELQRNLRDHFDRLVDQKAPLSARIRRFRQAEGDRFVFEDEEGNILKKGFHRFEGRVEIPIFLPIADTTAAVADQLERAAESIAAQSEGLLFTTHQEAVDSVGNAFDARGKPFDHSMMLDSLERIQIDFDKAGQPVMPTIVMHPDMLESVRPKLAEWEADPILKKRRADILAKKKEEWRDRESNRKLVG